MPLKYLKLKKADISRLQFILEGYEGFATATTIDKNIAVVKLFIVPDFVEETENLLRNLKGEIQFTEINSSQLKEEMS